MRVGTVVTFFCYCIASKNIVRQQACNKHIACLREGDLVLLQDCKEGHQCTL